MARRNWTDEEKAAALELLANVENSYYDVCKLTSVPSSTLCRWAEEAGLTGHSERLAGTVKAREARVERIAAKRAVIAEKLLDSVEEFNDKATEAAAKDAQSLMSALQIALGSFRLEMGEHTQATRSDTGSPRDRVKDRVDELEAKRQQRTA